MKKNQLNEIKKISKSLPKTIEEALNFEHDEQFMDNSEGMHDEPESTPEPESNIAMDVDKFLDDIRKQSLKGMAQLADNPLSEQYQTLKKVWQIVDKAAEAKQGQEQPQNTMKQF